MVQIVYESRTVFFKRILTHAEYDRPDWKMTILIENYERRYHIDPASTPAKRVLHLMDANDLKPADMLGIFGTTSIMSEVLSGKRELSKDHIRALSDRFQVSPEVFFS